MNRLTKQDARFFFLRLILAAVLVAAAFSGCEETTIHNPAAEPLPAPAAKPVNNSAVFAQGDGTCPASGPCIADYSVSLNGDETISWVFTGAQPPVSPIQGGMVQWSSPGSKNWTSSLCGAVGADGCIPAGGVVVFVEN